MIIHIILDEKFTDGFVAFINENFDSNEHRFLILASQNPMRYCKTSDSYKNVMVLHKNLKDMYELVYQCICADKVILHSLMIRYIPHLFGFRLFAKKTYVALWGGEIYSEGKRKKISAYLKHRILSRVRGITCELEEDYKLTQIKYNTNVPFFPCMLYLSNVVDEDDFGEHKNKRAKEKPIVMIGNSADPQNNHFEIIDNLAKRKINADFIVPLSYGDKEYAGRVAEYARNRLNGYVRVLQNFMPIEEYLNLLRSVDIVVYAHRRQQALGNTFHMLAYGAKVYLNSETTTYAWMKRNNIMVFPSDNIGDDFLELLTREEKKKNSDIISTNTSRKTLRKEWEAIFKD